MRTAIIFSGTAYNFKYSIKSLMENIIIPNDADVFILTERYNRIRKAPHTNDVITDIEHEEWYKKSLKIKRYDSSISNDEVLFIHQTFGDKLKGLHFIDDDQNYMNHINSERIKMMETVNEYRKESLSLGLPQPFGSDVSTPDNGNVRCMVDQYNHVKKCFELMQKYETENNFKYDYVVRMRLDFIATEEIIFSHYYLNQDFHYLYSMGSFRVDPFEWADEFCWFSKRDVAERLFLNLNRMGFITDRKYNTVYLPKDNDFIFAPECQYSLLLYELGISVINVPIVRGGCYTDGGDGFDYVSYKFRRNETDINNEYGNK